MKSFVINKKYVAISCIVLVLIFASVFYIRQTYQTTIVKAVSVQKMPLPQEQKVTLNTNGFSPQTLTIKVGTAVRWLNESSQQQTVNSDNYPTNQLHKELNFGVFASGSSVVYTFTTPGTYGYHNQFHPEQKGTIIVVR